MAAIGYATTFQWPLRGPTHCNPPVVRLRQLPLLVSMAAPRPTRLQPVSTSPLRWRRSSSTRRSRGTRFNGRSAAHTSATAREGLLPPAGRGFNGRSAAQLVATAHHKGVWVSEFQWPLRGPARCDLFGMIVGTFLVVMVFQWPHRGPHRCNGHPAGRGRLEEADSMAAPRPTHPRHRLAKDHGVVPRDDTPTEKVRPSGRGRNGIPPPRVTPAVPGRLVPCQPAANPAAGTPTTSGRPPSPPSPRTAGR